MSGFIPDLRGSVDHPSDFYCFLVIMELEIVLIDGGQAGLKAKGADEEGNETQTG